MKTFYLLAVVMTALLLVGCNDGSTPAPPPPAPLSGAAYAPANSGMRVGDKITIRLTGVPDDGYDIEMQIPQSGQITVPLLTQSFQTVGRSASEVADEIANAYKTGQIYSNPNVTIIPEATYVNVGGDVRGPARVAYTPDLTLLSTINSCGGFTEYADRHHVRILRGQQIIIVDCVLAQKDPGADPPVYPGDQIYVPRTPW
jgi:protein involved in polysaccharide export with SLBB domain